MRLGVSIEEIKSKYFMFCITIMFLLSNLLGRWQGCCFHCQPHLSIPV